MLTRESVSAFHREFDAVAKGLAEKHGMTYLPSKFYAETGMVKGGVVFGEKATTGGVNPIYVTDTAKFGSRFDLAVADVNKLEAKFGAKVYVFQGFKGRGWAIGKSRTDGKDYKFKPEDFAVAAGRKPRFLPDFGANIGRI